MIDEKNSSCNTYKNLSLPLPLRAYGRSMGTGKCRQCYRMSTDGGLATCNPCRKAALSMSLTPTPSYPCKLIRPASVSCTPSVGVSSGHGRLVT